MPRLSRQDRCIAMGQLQAGVPMRQVAIAFGVHISTVYRLLDRFQARNTTDDRPRSGRPRVTTAAQDRHLLRQHRREPYQTAANTARNTVGNHGRPISNRTVRRRLNTVGLQCRRPARRPILTLQHRQNRLQWAQIHVHWRHRDWGRVLFSDESRFCVDPGDGRIRIWRRAGERFTDANITERDPWGGESIMISGAIGINRRIGPVIFQNVGPGRGNGVTAVHYIDQVLRPHILPHFQRHPQNLFQQDNARPHTARATQNFLRQNNINLLPHPARSPDLNPIEHFWDALQRQLNQLNPRPQTAAQLAVAVGQVWWQVPQRQTNTLVRSMYRRCTAVINARGGHTRY